MSVAAQRTYRPDWAVIFFFTPKILFFKLRVTMPLKAAIMPFLDEISVEGQVTSACNTIVKVPLSADAVGSPNYKLVGTNTDSMSLSLMGVRRRGEGVSLC